MRTELQQTLLESQQHLTAAVESMRVAADGHQEKAAGVARIAAGA